MKRVCTGLPSNKGMSTVLRNFKAGKIPGDKNNYGAPTPAPVLEKPDHDDVAQAGHVALLACDEDLDELLATPGFLGETALAS